jgi:hypothetical protein
MGGNALKNYNVERKSKQDYNPIVQDVIAKMNSLFPDVKVAEIPAYSSKDTFGDADILIDRSNLPLNWAHQVEMEFGPQAFINNHPVYSFDYKQLQIDFILVPGESFEFSMAYSSYNDLGNLIGRIAHKMGLKFGHLGLMAPLRDNDHQYAEIAVTYDPSEAMRFLGFDPAIHQKGFKNLNEIFEYVITSKYVHSDIFLLSNINHKARVRDAKRPTYKAFLEWLKEHPEANKTEWSESPEEKAKIKEFYLNLACKTFPEFNKRYKEANAIHLKGKEQAARWNGHLVKEWTGLVGHDAAIVVRAGLNRDDYENWVFSSDSIEKEKYAISLAKNIDVIKDVEAHDRNHGLPKKSKKFKFN